MISDKEFFDCEVAAGVTPENPDYYRLMEETANVIDRYNVKAIIEIGSGMGTLIEVLNKRGYKTYGIEPNEYHRDHAKGRGVKLHDLNTYPDKCDMIVSIEVLEHLTDDEIDEYLKRIEAQYFFLSSTPTRTDWDLNWGHINIKTEDEWVTLFKKYEYKLADRLTMPTPWSLMFKK